MNLTKNKIFFGMLAFLLLINILVGFDINQFYIRAVLGFIFLITIPGLLIMLMMKIREVGAWEYLVYVVGLSISFIMFGGLAINWILPWLNITDKPLSLFPILICFNIFLLGFWIVAWIRNKDFKPLHIKYPKLDLTNRIFFIVPMLFPVLSILGAFLLNNHGTNILTMIMFGAITIYVFCLVLFEKKLNENIYPWVLWMIGLSLLLMLSLRSWYLGGFDITLEYYFFQLTKLNYFWSFLHSTSYNSCLSITILPTIFSLFSKINNEYIFKLFFPIIFSFFPIILYLFLSKSISKIYSFISTIFFLSWPFFIDPMVSLARQEIAFIFFGLMLLVLFTKDINPILKKVLFLVFGASMIVSHYSTSYVALALFTLIYFITLFYKKLKN